MPYEMFSVLFGDELLALRGEQYRNRRLRSMSLTGEATSTLCPCIRPRLSRAGQSPMRTSTGLMDELLTAVRNNAPADGMLMVFHGAMAGETEVDPEGHVLAEIRNILGDVPIVTTFDLHGIITDRLIEQSDIMVPFHTYPHIDMYETGATGVRATCSPFSMGLSNPQSRASRCPCSCGATNSSPKPVALVGPSAGGREIENSKGGLGSGVYIGNPFTDCARLALQCDCFYGQRPQARTR